MATLARCQLQVTDDNGDVVNGASIEVRRESNNALIQLYSDRDGTLTIGNPFVAADGGDAGFYVSGGAYKITATLGLFSRVWRHLGVGTNQEADLGTQFANYILTFNAYGPFSGRSTYDAQPAGFTYYATDQHGFYAKLSAASGNWSALIPFRQRYEFLMWDNAKPQAGETVTLATLTADVTFPAALAGSYARSQVAATASSVFSIRKNGVQFATATFAIGATTATFTAASDTAFAPGDTLSIVAPNPQDGSLASVYMTILGYRT